MRDAIFDTIARLRREGTPFCLATVTRTAHATSAKAGAKAVVTSEGEITGHLGGACVRRAVVTAAATALAEESVRLIRVAPGEGTTESGEIARFASGCPSGGTVDLLIEPFRPAPWLAVFGRTPVAAAIARQGALLGWQVGAGEGSGLEATASFTPDLAPLDLGPRDAVVIACQGEGDLAALQTALSSAAGFVSMVASRQKAGVLKQRLASRSLSPERLATLRAPAGVSIGAVDPGEIALSVLAEVVAWRRGCLEAAGPALDQTG
ncbi:MAG: XdhC family protein [Pseudomonadota bacterium]